MIRFIGKREYKCQHSGATYSELFTVDADVPELAEILCGGGVSENGFDVRQLVGCELLADQSKEPTP